jgi:hypothetical protein
VFCECGCGEEVKAGRRFKPYHHNHGANHPRFGRGENWDDGNPLAQWRAHLVYQRKNGTYFIRRLVPSIGKTRRFGVRKVNCAVCGCETFTQNAHKQWRHTCSESCEKVIRAGCNSPQFKGGKKSKRGSKGGHILVYMPDHPFSKKSYVPEHQLVIEKQIGRYLRPEEIPHHLDLDPTNNDPENLFLCANHKEHFIIHGTLNHCVAKLMAMGVLKFNRDTKCYEVNG